MGQVYRARDTRLNRDVALKVMPEAVAFEPERLARFEREALALAALNHANIAHIIGVEESSGVRALVMELVEGPTLHDRLAHGPLPIDEALPIARQIVDALEAAHEHGIIHRDLKPANIKVRPDGAVKVLDFGLAKSMEPAVASSSGLSLSPTITSPAMTQAGILLGTAAYMSPEQARGKAVDKRADIWAFGAVLFEMLTGQRAFGGDDLSMTLAAVVMKDPEWDALPAATPRSVQHLLRRCLVKDPRQRIRDMGDVRLALEGASDIHAPSSDSSQDGRWTRAAAFRLAAAAVVIASAVTGVSVWLLSRATPATVSSIARLVVTLPDGQRIGGAGMAQPALAVSPQGTLIAYVAAGGGREQLYVRPIDRVESRALAGTEPATNPFFSPDGQWIGFFAQGKLKKVSLATGTVQTLCDAPNGRGGTWSDGTIYFAATGNAAISKVSADGGVPTEVTALDRAKGEFSHRWPQVLPGSEALLFDVWTGPGNDEKQVHVQRLDTGMRTVVVQAGASGRYAASGHVIYARNDELFVVPFDVRSLSVSGEARRLGDTTWRGSEGHQYAMSDNGVLVTASGSPTRYERRLVWVGRDGRVEALPAPPGGYSGNAVISPDGRRAAVDMESGTVGIWLYDFVRATLTPLTTGKGSSQAPRWSPDGTRVVYRGTRMGSGTCGGSPWTIRPEKRV